LSRSIHLLYILITLFDSIGGLGRIPTNSDHAHLIFDNFEEGQRIVLLMKFYRYLDNKEYDGERIYQHVLDARRLVGLNWLFYFILFL